MLSWFYSNFSLIVFVFGTLKQSIWQIDFFLTKFTKQIKSFPRIENTKRQRGTHFDGNQLMNTEHNNLIYPKLHENIIKKKF